ncbi:hypothetical protein ANO14919_092790 [Xylariales sp. No.14919]|nr:hypothetical protein ANO14919_092790 [Xylariales sp. No.14919]
MAHIATCMIDSDGETNSLRSYIANTFSAKASTDSLVSSHSIDEKKPFAWRMHNQEARKYQLFPKEKQLPPVTAAKPLDLEQAHAIAMGQSPDKSDKSGLSNGLLLRIKEHNLTRRRKVSVPELGPMTTVQEVSMDSPTIPGRPALHERSISTPVNTLRLTLRTEPKDSSETAEIGANNGILITSNLAKLPNRQPLSPKDLAPLTIPSQTGTFPALARKLSMSRLRSGSNQQEQPVRPPRPDESPKTRAPFAPFTPLSATGSTTTPRSATTYATNSTIPTPISAPPESHRSASPWEKPHSSTATALPQASADIPSIPKPDPDAHVRSASAMAHRRGRSDSGSIMERGRPRKRTDGTLIGTKHGRNESKRSLSTERRAFETLPQGYRPSDAVKKLDHAETLHLQKQALGQAARFEVLRKEDVDSLSKELRQLDERTDYLRHTYTSLRAGRRNLQSRVCQYLRSPRMAKFSYESMLKQEETLAELDASIDDWVTKLEHAENRRTRVRQKLLEHVAAAAAMSATTGLGGNSETLHQAMGIRTQPSANDISTPPRSPTKAATPLDCSSPSPSSSPQRVVARVPSAIIEEENEDGKSHRSRLSTQTALERMESIRIYADSDVYALLEDVENEFTKLNEGVSSPELSSQRPTQRPKKALKHARSQDVLAHNGAPNVFATALNRPQPLSPPAPSPPMKNSPTRGGDVFLTAAVFQPQQTTVNA